MKALEEFHRLRRSFLARPASEELRAHPNLRLSGSAPSLLRVYELFDGETMWSAWLPGYRICSIAEVLELMESTADSWEWLEEERNEKHPMRLFIPFIQTSMKTSVGPVLDDRTALYNHVIEYDYESGEILTWSRSIDQFLEAFFEFSIVRVHLPQSTEERIGLSPHEFSEGDIEFLSRWPDIVFPVAPEPAKRADEI